MLQRTLGSGWGVLLPGLLIAGLMYADLSPDQWRIVILMGLVLTSVSVSPPVTSLLFATLVRGGYCCHVLMILNLNQGLPIPAETRKEVKIIGARGGT